MDTPKHEHEVEKVDKAVKMLSMQDTERGQALPPAAKLGTLEEESENEQKGLSTTDYSGSSEEESVADSTDAETDVSDSLRFSL